MSLMQSPKVPILRGPSSTFQGPLLSSVSGAATFEILLNY